MRLPITISGRSVLGDVLLPNESQINLKDAAEEQREPTSTGLVGLFKSHSP